MLAITAIIRARPGSQDIVRKALLSLVGSVRETEPQTIGYFVMQSSDDPGVFTTFERFVDRVAMERHNCSDAVARFIRETDSHLEGKIIIHAGEELASK